MCDRVRFLLWRFLRPHIPTPQLKLLTFKFRNQLNDFEKV